MKAETDASLSFIGVRLINCTPRIETKVYIKPTNSGLLLHYQSHVDNRYKRGLIVTMLDRAYRLSSHWSHFTEECDRLREVFLKLKYPLRLITTAIKQVIDSKMSDDQHLIPTQDNTIRVILPFKDQESANIVKKRLNNPSSKIQRTLRPVFVSRKLNQDLQVREAKPAIVSQQCVVYQFKCNLCDAGYVGYYKIEHNALVPKNLISQFHVLAKCKNKFDCLVKEMLFIRRLVPDLNVQTDSIRAKVFVYCLMLIFSTFFNFQ